MMVSSAMALCLETLRGTVRRRSDPPLSAQRSSASLPLMPISIGCSLNIGTAICASSVRGSSVGPSVRRIKRHVGQRHGASSMRLPCRSPCPGETVGERALLLMARRARISTVTREARVVEETTSEANFCLGHRIVGWNLRMRYAPAAGATRTHPPPDWAQFARCLPERRATRQPREL